MVQTFEYIDLTPEEQAYLDYELEMAKMPVRKGQVFINHDGRLFSALESSPAGHNTVHVKEYLPNGHSNLYVSKTILV